MSWEGTPHPQARTRITKRGHRYRPDEEHQEELRAFLATQAAEPLTGSIVVACAFYLPDRRTRDTDNLVKHVLDSANGVLWGDDRQVTAEVGYAELDRERPRTIMVYGADELTTLAR